MVDMDFSVVMLRKPFQQLRKVDNLKRVPDMVIPPLLDFCTSVRLDKLCPLWFQVV